MASNAIVGALRVTLGLDSAAFENGLTDSQKKLQDAGNRLNAIGGRLATVGVGMTAAITAPLAALGMQLLQGGQDAAAAAAQVNSALASMGDASGKTADELAATAESLRNLTGVDDDEILKSVTANLLTFGNVAGATFDRAQRAILDLSTRLGTDLQSATLMVGKALNDPIKGLTALRRTGIQFTEEQEAQIKAMQGVGDMAGAQAIMLAELERQFGGAAEAAAKADMFTPLKTAMMDLEGAFEPIVRNVAVPLVEALAGIARSFANLPAPAQQFIAVAAGIAAAVGPILIAVGGVVAAMGSLAGALGTGGVLAGVGALLAPIAPLILPIAAAVAAVVGTFLLFRDDIEPVLKRLWAVAQETLGPPLQQIIGSVRELVGSFVGLMKALFETDAVQALMKFQMAYASVLGEALIQILGTVMRVVGVVITAISDGFKVLAALLRGDWSGAWEAYKTGVTNVITGLRNAFSGLADWAVSSMQRLVTGVASWLVNRFQQLVVEPVRQKIEAVKGFFFGLYDAVVGHSYIPDMVEGVAAWMAKLDAGMVQPARNATAEAQRAFQKLRDDVAVIMEGLLTDAERNAREVADKIAKIRAAAAGGVISPTEAAQAEGGVWAEGMTMPEGPKLDPTKPLIPQETLDSLNSLGETTKQISAPMQQAIGGILDATVSLTDGLVDLAITGQGSLADLLKSFVATVAKIILEMLALKAVEMATGIPVSAMMGGSGGGGLGNFFGNLLGFRDGGSFNVGGSGPVDSKLVAFRATPGERVDISTPGQQRQQGGGYQLTVNPSPYFDVQVQKIATPVATEIAMAGGAAITKHVFDTLGKDRERSRYTRSGYR